MQFPSEVLLERDAFTYDHIFQGIFLWLTSFHETTSIFICVLITLKNDSSFVACALVFDFMKKIITVTLEIRRLSTVLTIEIR